MTHPKFKPQSRNRKRPISAESRLLQDISKEVVFGNNRQNVLKKVARWLKEPIRIYSKHSRRAICKIL